MAKYLLVEDERFAYEEMLRMMQKLRSGYQLAGWTKSVTQTIEFLKANTVDLILLDIRLADGNSFEIFEQINISVPIIFTTAYDNFAIKAFKLNSVDYLLKPVEEAELQGALDKYERQSIKKSDSLEYRKLEESLLNNWKKNRFLIQKGDYYNYIETDKIAFFYSEEKVVFLHTFEEKRYIVNYTLDQIEKLLDTQLFFRVSRNCIANIQSIKQIYKHFNSRLKLSFEPECPHEVLVSRIRVPDFLKWVDGIH